MKNQPKKPLYKRAHKFARYLTDGEWSAEPAYMNAYMGYLRGYAAAQNDARKAARQLASEALRRKNG